MAQRPAGGYRTPAGPAHRRLRARHRPGTGPASRMPSPRPAPRLGARSCTMTAPRTSRRAGHRGPARPRAGSPKRSPGQPQSHGAAGAPDPAIARSGAVRCSGMRERRGAPIDLFCTLQLMDAVRSAAAPNGGYRVWSGAQRKLQHVRETDGSRQTDSARRGGGDTRPARDCDRPARDARPRLQRVQTHEPAVVPRTATKMVSSSSRV